MVLLLPAGLESCLSRKQTETEKLSKQMAEDKGWLGLARTAEDAVYGRNGGG